MRTRAQKWGSAFAGAAVFLVTALTIVLLLAVAHGPDLARDIVETQLTSALDRQVRVEKLIFRPGSGEFGAAGFTIEKGPSPGVQPMLRVGSVILTLDLTRIWPPEIVVSSVDIADMGLDLEAEPAAKEEPSGEPLAITLPSQFQFGPLTIRFQSVTVSRGSFRYRDNTAHIDTEAQGIQIAVRPKDSGLAVEIDAESVAFQSPEVSESVSRVQIKGDVEPQRILLESSSIFFRDEEIRVKGRILDPFSDLVLDLKVDGTVPLTPINRYMKEPWFINGSVRTEATVTGPAVSPRAHWKLHVPQLTAGPLAAQAVYIDGEYNASVLKLHDVRANLLDGTLQGLFEITPGKLSQTRAEVHLKDISLKSLRSVSGDAPKAAGRVSVDASVRGDPTTLDGLEGQLRLTGRQLVLPERFAELGPGTLEAKASVAQGRASISEITGVWPAARVGLTGVIDAKGPFQASADFAGDMKRLAKVFDWKAFDGASELTAKAHGSWKELTAEGEVLAEIIGANGTNWGRLQVPYRLRDKDIRVHRATAKLGQSQLNVTGDIRLGENISFDGQVDATPLRMEDISLFLPPDQQPTGSLTLRASVKGKPTMWQGSGNLRADRLAISNVILRDLKIDLKGDQKGAVLEKLDVSVNGASLKAEGRWGWNGTGRASVVMDPTSLATIDGLPEDLNLTGNAAAEFTGSVNGEKINAAGKISLKDVSIKEWVVGNGALNLSVQNSLLDATLALPKLGLSGKTTGDLRGGGTVESLLTLENFDLETVMSTFAPELAEHLEGRISGLATVKFPSRDPSAAHAAVRLDPVRFSVAGHDWENQGAVAVEWRQGDVHLQQLALRSPAGGKVTASGRLKSSETLELRAEAQLPLELLVALTPEIQRAGGTLNIDASVTGPLAQPRVEAKGELVGGSLLVNSYPDPLRQIEAAFVFTPKGGRLTRLEASLGSGRIRGSGELALTGATPGPYQLKLALRDLPVNPLDGLRTTWNGDLELVGFAKRAILRGDLKLLRGSYTNELSLLSLILHKRAASGGVRSSEPPVFDLNLKVRVHLDGNFVVRSSLARLRAGGTLSVEGPVQQPVIFGSVDVSEGYITFQRRRFDLSRAVVRFVDPRQIDPLLDIIGTGTVKGYEVTMQLSGRPNDLTVNLSSDPSLPEEDLLSLVAFGATREQFGGSAASVLAGEAATLIAGDLFGTGSTNETLDVLEVDSDGADSTTVKVGKKVTEDTMVLYSQDVRQDNKRRLRIEHRLVGPLIIAGGPNSEGGFETDLVVRFKFR